MEKYPSIILRIGLGFVFLWFGFSQATNPEAWTSLIPEFVTNLTGMSAHTFVLLNGGAEIIGGVLLVIGFYTRIVSFLLFLHLVTIILDVGLTSIGVRDIGLALSCLALSSFGVYPSSLDGKRNSIT